jgi:hypothetical protein
MSIALIAAALLAVFEIQDSDQSVGGVGADF